VSRWNRIGGGAVTVPTAVQNGVFLVDSGSDRFLATPHDGGIWRWDLGCMTPCDERAHGAVEYFAGLEAHALVHEWTEPNLFVLIDNAQTLHARADATGDNERQLTRLAYAPRSQ